MLSTHRGQEAGDVAGGVGSAPVAPRRVVHHPRDVVVDDEAAETDVLQRLHDLEDVAVAVAEEALVELFSAALDVPQMHVKDATALPDVSDLFQHAFPGAHLAPATLAKPE